MDAKTLGNEPVEFIPSDCDRHTPDVDGYGYRGLTKRELFAAMAMQGLLANSGGPYQANGRTGWGIVNCTVDQMAQECVQVADALLIELAKDQP